MSLEKDAQFWDKISRRYSKSKVSDQPGYERSLERTREYLNESSTVLELGCGTGTTALALADSTESYLATDISPSMIDIAQEKLAAEPASGLVFQVATAQALADGNQKYDAIVGFNYLHLVRELPDVLKSIHSMLASDGLFISKTPCVGNMNPFIRWVLIPILRAIGKAPYVDPFKADALTDHLKTAGFEVVLNENHASNGKGYRPYIVVRKK